MERKQGRSWTRADSAAYYALERWGAPYFAINGAGNICFAAPHAPKAAVDLRALVDDLTCRGLRAPVLLRFNDVLHNRTEHLHRAFAEEIAAAGYEGSYRGVLPIKVNQQRHVVEQLVAFGANWQLGLEVGSKPELLAAIALLADRPGAMLVCNGYKDAAYVESALYASCLGLQPYIVIERREELALVLAAAERCGIRPQIGLRAKLSARGAGRWKDSSGETSKFGLSAADLVQAVATLRAARRLDCLHLLHFHLGSQINAIDSVGRAVHEAARIYVELRAQGADALDVVDCGGGLAVDYDGSSTAGDASADYCTRRYARQVVGALADVCNRAGAPHPTIVTESGRALVAQHAVLVFDVLGVRSNVPAASGQPSSLAPPQALPAASQEGPRHVLWRKLQDVARKVQKQPPATSYAQLLALKDQSEAAFSAGTLTLSARAQIEQIYWRSCQQLRAHWEEMLARGEEAADGAGSMSQHHALCANGEQSAVSVHPDVASPASPSPSPSLSPSPVPLVPLALRQLRRQLVDTYLCNFSIFQSLPDSWAVDQLFPLVPLQRHHEAPDREAVLVDLTCDSDGKIDQFVGDGSARSTLRLHAPNGDAYYVGAFLVGAYQEILGDLHNLFGDTHTVHVSVRKDGSYVCDHLQEGDRVADVLGAVAYGREDLLQRVQRAAESQVASGNVAPAQLATFVQHYADGLSGYTYLQQAT